MRSQGWRALVAAMIVPMLIGVAPAAAAPVAPVPAGGAATAAPAGTPASLSRTAISPAGLLRGDRTMDLGSGLSGTLDLAGYNVRLDPVRGPVFDPAGGTTNAVSAGNWAALGSAFRSLDGEVNAIANLGSDVYVAGGFESAGGVPGTVGIARWDGVRWNALGAGATGDIHALAVDGTDIYVGGSFRDMGGIAAADYVAKWNGSAWSALGNDGSGDGSIGKRVNAIAVVGDDVYVGGDFLVVEEGGAPLANTRAIARWDGANWTGLGANPAGVDSLNSIVTALATNGSDLYVGGRFVNVRTGSTTLLAADNIAMWSGGAWSAMGGTTSNGGAMTGAVRALAVGPGGVVYAGGDFQNIRSDAVTYNEGDYVAQWNGSAWSPLGGNGGSPVDGSLGGSVRALAVVGSTLYAAGDFTDVNNGGTVLGAADRIARWDGAAWSALGSDGAGDGSIRDGQVNAIAATANTVFAGGNFERVTSGGRDRSGAYLSTWSPASGAWTSVPSSSGALTGRVHAMAIQGSDLYVGGDFFDLANGDTLVRAADNIARWNGSAWFALGQDGAGDGAIDGDVLALAFDAAGNLYAGGEFTNVDNRGTVLPAADHLARWDGTNWAAVGASDAPSGGSLNGDVRALAIDGNGVLVGGSFTDVRDGSTTLGSADFIARWDRLAGQWSPLGNAGFDGALNGDVRAIAVMGTDVFAGGDFIDVNNNGTAMPEADRVARWNGTSWSALASNGMGNGSLNDRVFALGVRGTSLYVGGDFTDVANTDGIVLPAADALARWDGQQWSAVGTGVGGDGSLQGRVQSIAFDGLGNVFVAGSFSNVASNGAVRGAADRVARFDGADWTALGSDGAADGSLKGAVADCVVIGGSTAYVSGSFTDVSNNGTILPAADYLAAFGLTVATRTFRSAGSADGWVRESSETSNRGGARDASSSTLRLGDDSKRRQYRSVLSFATASLPDGAVVTRVTLRVRRSSVTGGGNPVTKFGGFIADVRRGRFRASSLELGDFGATATKSTASQAPTASSGWYAIDLTSALAAINRTTSGGGLTQVRLRFLIGDDNDRVAEYLSMFSGNAASTSRPQLIVEYLQ